ncbi:predicted protein [Nematostella vectensis]|uniref:RBR-type E3 ubiquitin transferase n=1 Tax=Nematostella vectensis TaxID=45351 RepID=A7SEN1_NEMVE|nr:uncharacterized protein LOC5509366 [Nematostella vectensis]EDO37844.1 predicted protein [Nematostella vectensis]|eukprot:XP_001629907.1 predicted protein [Nematostella vectensis]
MVLREGKYGHSTGKTLRSKFARGSKYHGGIELLRVKPLRKIQNSSNNVVFSLNKKKRWLIPEDIKQSGALRDDYGVECLQNMSNVILVERQAHDSVSETSSKKLKTKQGYCTLVFEGEVIREKTPKLRYAQAKILLQDMEVIIEVDENAKSVEILRPFNKGSWPHNLKYNAKEKPIPKKSLHRGKNKRISYLDTADYYDYEDYQEEANEEENGDKEFSSRYPSLQLSDFLITSEPIKGHVKRESPLKSHGQNEISTDTHDRKQHCVNLCQENEIKKHKELRRMGSEMIEFLSKSNPRKASVLYKHEPHRIQRFAEHGERGKKVHRQFTDDKVQEEHFKVCVSFKESELHAKQLLKNWGNMYHESGSLPRKFTIDISSLVAGCSYDDVAPFVWLLFEEADTCEGKQTVLIRSLVVCDGLERFSIALCQSIKKELILKLHKLSNSQDNITVTDIIFTAVNFWQISFEKYGTQITTYYKNPSNLMIEQVFGWKCISFSHRLAKLEVRKAMTKCGSQLPSSKPNGMLRDEVKFCGICCLKFEHEDFSTGLLLCSHKFCNSCWHQYLTVQIRSGHSPLKCPGHMCDAIIDDTTVMSLVPELLEQFIRNKVNMKLCSGQQWQQCEKCAFYVKLVLPTCIANSTEVPVHVVCRCGNTWCSRCKDEPHWPASCSQAERFWLKYADQLSEYQRKDLFYSVYIKRCPHCRYPIEKNGGCPHMYCILCKATFCWHCLTLFSKHSANGCSIKKEEKILLQSTGLYKSAKDVAISSRTARAPGFMKKFLRKGVHFSKDHFSPLLMSYLIGQTPSAGFRKDLDIPEVKQAIFATHHFVFQAHIVLEGAAIKLASEPCGRRIHSYFSRLLRAVDAIENTGFDHSQTPTQLQNQVRKNIFLIKKCLGCISSFF